jgi:hypothetical protein
MHGHPPSADTVDGLHLCPYGYTAALVQVASDQAALEGDIYPARPDVDNIAKTVLDGMNGSRLRRRCPGNVPQGFKEIF